MKKKLLNKNGFTLVEVIAVLLISSFLTALAGFGIVQLTKSYVLAKETGSISADADFALARIRKSIRSLVDIVDASETMIEIKRINTENIIIKEKFSYENNILKLYINDEDFGPLAMDVGNFKLSYDSAKKGVGEWMFSIDDKKDLSAVNAEIEYPGPYENNFVFRDKILPRNTFFPDMGYIPPGSGAGSQSICFITSANINGIKVLIFEIKKKFANAFKGLSQIFKKYLLVLFFCSATFVFTSKFIFFVLKRKKLVLAENKKGSLILVIAVSIAVTGLLGAGAVSFLTSSESSNAGKIFGQRAYYNSESGLRYALSVYMEDSENDTGFADKIINNNQIYKTANSDGFYLDFQSYYFRPASGSLVSVGNTPDIVKKHGIILQGKFELKIKGAQSRSIHNVSNISYDSSNKIVTADGLPENMDENENVLFVINADGDQSDIRISELGSDDSAGEIIVRGGLTGFMPPVNGVVSFYADTDKNGSYDEPVSVLYDRIDYSSNKLQGLRALPGKSIPDSKFNISDSADIVCGRYAKIVSTGVSGIDTPKEAKVSLSLNQPLDSVDLVKMISNEEDGINDYESVLGTHEIVSVDSTLALKLGSTQSSYSYTQSPLDNIAYQQESLAAYDWSSKDPDFLKNLWLKSDKKLSYEVQVKVKFTEEEDDLSSSPLNHPGNYMPGISFRVRKPSQGDIGQATYYGMSFMRGISGRTEHSEGGTGCQGASFYETEDDDITDNFFYPHGDHEKNPLNEPEFSCSDTDFTPSRWNDDPPLDGIPYLVFWQKEQSTDSQGDPLNTGCGSSGSYSPFEWLSYMPLVEAEKCTIYNYGITLYAEKNFNNSLVSLGVGEYTLFDLNAAAGQNINDSLSSIKIPDGYKVIIYEHDNFNGSSYELYSDERNMNFPWWGNFWNDRVSSIKIEYLNGNSDFPIGYYDGQVGGFTSNDSYTAWRLKDKYNILKKHEVDGQNILGLPGQIKIKDPQNPDKLMEDSAYILPPVDTDSSYSDEEYQYLKSIFNYRLYIKPWAVIGLRIMEFEGNLDCDPNGELERINAVTAFFGSEDETGSGFGNLKDGSRKGYAKNISNSNDYSVKWPSSGDYFTNAVWNGLGFNNSNEPLFPTDGGYTSKTVTSPDYGGCLSSFTNIKLVEKGYDLENDPVTVYSATFLTKGGNLGTKDYFKNYDVPEIGLHTLGISASEETPENQRETVYFKDFYWRFFEGGSSVALPGVITE
jgi:prepilin-type N-terminal cleavage/methylation domain-containing protein